jgi:hypothetical protein
MNSDILVPTLRLLHAVEGQANTSEQHDALRASRLILYFILARHEGDEFDQFLKSSTMRPMPSSLFFQRRRGPTHGSSLIRRHLMERTSG